MLTHSMMCLRCESLTLVDVDALSDVLVLVESLTLLMLMLNDVLPLIESLTLVDVDP